MLPAIMHASRASLERWTARRVCVTVWWFLWALPAPAAEGPEGWIASRQGPATVFAPPGESMDAVSVLRLPDQPAQGDVAAQLQQWLDALAEASGGRAASSEPVRRGTAARGAWDSWAGQVDSATGSRWWLLMVRQEGSQCVAVLLNAVDTQLFARHGQASIVYFDRTQAIVSAQAPDAVAPPQAAVPARLSTASLVGVWTNLPPPADTADLRRDRLLASPSTGLWLDLRADGSMRYASEAPRYATAGGLTTEAVKAPLVTGGDRLDGRYQEGTWRLEGQELVFGFERGRHLDAIDRPDANQPWYRGGGRRYPLELTPQGTLRLSVMPGQWMDPLRRVAQP